MKLLSKDIGAGRLKLRIDTLDDLWALRNLLQKGDIVTAVTWRTAENATDKVRAEKMEKKRMTLGVRVEDVLWHDFDDHLRIQGVIESGPQDLGRHHTHTLRDDRSDITITKPGPLRPWHLDLIKEAEAATKAPHVVLLAIDDSEAQFAILRGHGIQWLGSLPATGQGKRFAGSGDAKKRFYEEAAKTLATLRADSDVPLVVLGPGWWREEFLEHLQEKHVGLADGALTDGTSQGGRAGIQEALKRGQVDRVARDHRVQQETTLVEELFLRMGQGGLVAIGRDEVSAAVLAGAAEEVLVTDDAVRHGTHDDVLQSAGETRCRVRVIATAHEAGARLEQLGGLACLLRFAMA